MGRSRVLHGEAVLKLRARDHHAWIQAREQRRDEQDHAEPGHREGPAGPAADHEDDRERGRGDRERRRQDRRKHALVIAVDGNDHRPDHEDGGRCGGGQREAAGGQARALAKRARRLQRQEPRTVEREEQDDCQAGEDGVGMEEVPERPGEVAVRVERDAVEEVREPDSPDQRCAEASERVGAKPGGPPARARALPTPFERDDADDQEEEDEQEREVEAREHRRVPAGEGRERRSADDDEPDLVAVPDRADRLEHRLPLALVSGEERQQHADAEVEALEHEVARPEDGDHGEPEDLEVHAQYPGAGVGTAPPSSPRSTGSRPA